MLYSQYFKESKNQFSDLSFQFFEAIEIESNLLKIKKQSKDLVNFKKNFFFWFDHLKALQFIHFYTDNKYPKISIFDAAHQFLERKELNIKQDDARSILELFRTLDK